MSTQEIINIGTTPNDGEGDPLRVAFQKVNNNFSNLFNTASFTSNIYSVGNTPGQVIFSTPANAFTAGSFQIRSNDPGTNDSQLVTISAQINSDNTNVKFVAYGTTFFGNAITTYDMSVTAGNVLLKVNPLTNNPLYHFVSSQILYMGNSIPGVPIELDGYFSGSLMETENNLNISTEN